MTSQSDKRDEDSPYIPPVIYDAKRGGFYDTKDHHRLTDAELAEYRKNNPPQNLEGVTGDEMDKSAERAALLTRLMAAGERRETTPSHVVHSAAEQLIPNGETRTIPLGGQHATHWHVWKDGACFCGAKETTASTTRQTEDGPLGGFAPVGPAAVQLDFLLTQFQNEILAVVDDATTAEDSDYHDAEALKLKREIIDRFAASATPRITEGPFAGLPKPVKVPEGYVMVDEKSFKIILGVLTEEQTREICMKEGERLYLNRADGGKQT